jgi:hypothetical protein
MMLEDKYKFGSRGFHSRKVLFFVCLLFVLLIVSGTVYVLFMRSDKNFSPDEPSMPSISSPISNGDIHVESERQLRNAINNAKKPTSIALLRDVILTEALVISANKDITLTSNSDNANFFKLIGADEHDTLFVEDGGVLKLDKIIVTHKTGDSGRGAKTEEKGTLIMISGIISDNTAFARAGGVYNTGNFTMLGGEIFNNKVSASYSACYGGGVYNADTGNFTMLGGRIFNNIVSSMGGGVYNDGDFNILGNSVISNNNAMFGGGVYNDYKGVFSMSGSCAITNNYASYGGGGVSGYGVVSMSGNSVISNNIANSDGGGVFCHSFSMSGNSRIDSNTAIHRNGGGVYAVGSFVMTDNCVISNNTANTGGGAYIDGGELRLSNSCTISDNVASNGGGVYNKGTFTMSGGKIFNNAATNGCGGGVFHTGYIPYQVGSEPSTPVYSTFTMYGGVISNNRATTGGGVYIGNYGSFNSNNGTISDNTASNGNNVWDSTTK